MSAAYLSLYQSGELARRAEAAVSRLAACDLCPHICRVDRHAGSAGDIAAGAVCRTGRQARVASVGPGFQEEPAIVGTRGSGDILFAWCNMRCAYCENADVSMQGAGEAMDAQALAEAMLSLQAQGCHNINLVGPSHVVPQILEALVIATGRGLTLPLVFNSGGYDRAETVGLLDGVVDIYTPDIKYGDDMAARRYSKVRDYVAVNREALAEMVRQVGPLRCGADGLAYRGVLIRHLLLPRDIGNVTRALDAVRDLAGAGMTVSLLDTYHPAHQADRMPDLREPVPPELAGTARAYAERLGLVPLA
ncbi:radical SAM protein [Roseospira marina]|uniref:Radical SAM protein n=1 Tax=Roseospira marina TaxID=140057 RepID=A0A5M6IHA8_9PROT|nr:radical SAM protein [Roseospira marina]KAA5607005.1 radical SAM protein [Roseospira marina]MBB4312812.1 putative pyruvate formate lyase activating enzyme [Roseospira marina]MBB5086415.1 putative pyruvate formate lyase activating enzyme [Roseospira marina]